MRNNLQLGKRVGTDKRSLKKSKMNVKQFLTLAREKILDRDPLLITRTPFEVKRQSWPTSSHGKKKLKSYIRSLKRRVEDVRKKIYILTNQLSQKTKTRT